MKRCPACGREKPTGDFPKDRSKKDGLAARCRACDRARSKAQYAKRAAERRVIARQNHKEATVGKVRLCERCGEPATSSRHHLCDACRTPKPPSRQAKTAERGYGEAHKKERKRYARLVKAGRANCARCGGVILPDQEWHLDHTDDRTAYLGPSHADCNVKAAAPKRRARATSRDW